VGRRGGDTGTPLIERKCSTDNVLVVTQNLQCVTVRLRPAFHGQPELKKKCLQSILVVII
jgi:hypothetical protein